MTHGEAVTLVVFDPSQALPRGSSLVLAGQTWHGHVRTVNATTVRANPKNYRWWAWIPSDLGVQP